LISHLLSILESKKLKFTRVESNQNGFIIEFNLRAKPGSKIERSYIAGSGELVIQTRARPIEGEANKAIVESVAELFGVSKSQVEIIRGDKSKIKRIKLLVEITANKNQEYFALKFTSLLSQEV